MGREPYVFDQLHIDIARNSTDDFNPFHDPVRFSRIAGNPFDAPIALGFQLEFLAADRVLRHRATEQATRDEMPPYSNYEFNFPGAIRAGEAFDIDVRRTVDKRASGGGLSNRVVVRKSDGSPVLIGTQSRTATPRVDVDLDLAALPDPRDIPDRSFLPASGLYLKRKFLTTSNAKNFALGALCRQQDYIDELAEQIHFGPLFTASLLSCALLERGRAQGHDFEAAPMVYTNHQLSVHMPLQERLRSNDALHFLVAPPERIEQSGGLGRACVEQQLFRCAALLDDGSVLLRARVQLAALDALLAPPAR